jgi:hypothetical protein
MILVAGLMTMVVPIHVMAAEAYGARRMIGKGECVSWL